MDKSNKKILIIDDNIRNIQVVANILKEEGYKIAIAQSGMKGIRVLNKVMIDLILLDVMMPEMSGFDVCKILKDHRFFKEIPIIFLTAKHESKDIVKGFNIGGVDYIAKPFNRNELLVRVHTHLTIKDDKEIIEEQSVKLNDYNKRLTDSIKYASLIQKKMLPSENLLKSLFPNSFILYKPKDYVSGDFYWVNSYKNVKMFAVADCTGHGVPGSLLSIMAITFLNHNFKKLYYEKPAKILDELRNYIKLNLGQESLSNDILDGLDMGLISYRTEENEFEFAGGNISLFIADNSSITKVKSDTMPLSIYLKEKPFTNHKINIKNNQTYYMSTDGYQDQYNHNDKKRFSQKRLMSLIKFASNLDLNKQKQILTEKINEWRKQINLTDDILIAGFKF